MLTLMAIDQIGERKCLTLNHPVNSLSLFSLSCFRYYSSILVLKIIYVNIFSILFYEFYRLIIKFVDLTQI
jgi:hypothetical protein